jgi:hypothetical protein
MSIEIVSNLKAQEEDSHRLESNISSTSLERSVDNILNRIYDDIKKLLK